MFDIIWQPPQNQGLNDCGVPVEWDPEEQPAPAIARCELRPHPQLQMLPLDEEYTVAFVPSLSRVAVVNAAVRRLLQCMPLTQGGDDADLNAALSVLHQLHLIGDDAIAVTRPQTLLAWLHLTNACNLRCSYCYIAKSGEAMSTVTACAALDAVVRSARAHKYRAVALKYAGGEPSLAMPLIEHLHRYALNQTDAAGLDLQASMLSNGSGLSHRALALIRALGIDLTISVDGLAVTHDIQRPTSTGRESSTLALTAIERALDAQITPLAAITVTTQSVDGLPELVTWLLERDIPFTVSFARDSGCGGSWKQDDQRIIDGMRLAYQVIAQNPPRWSLLGALLDRTDGVAPHQHACAAGENYLVIDHHGKIAKCQMTMHHTVATITDADPLWLVRADQAGIPGLSVEQKAGCRQCEWRYWCAGGCAVATYQATGRYDVASPNCAIYKALYPDLLRLEGQRLLGRYQVQKLVG